MKWNSTECWIWEMQSQNLVLILPRIWFFFLFLFWLLRIIDDPPPQSYVPFSKSRNLKCAACQVLTLETSAVLSILGVTIRHSVQSTPKLMGVQKSPPVGGLNNRDQQIEFYNCLVIALWRLKRQPFSETSYQVFVGFLFVCSFHLNILEEKPWTLLKLRCSKWDV